MEEKVVQKVVKSSTKSSTNLGERKIYIRTKIYECDLCGYNSKNMTNYKKHLKSKKHIKNSGFQKSSANPEKEKFLREVINTQQQQIQTLIDVMKLRTTTTNTNCNNTIINNNNTISVNVYLNEDCKNALNIKDFVDQIQVKLEDCIYPSSKLVKDNIVSNLFIDNLKKLTDEERPVHCVDARRGKYVVKDNDEWTEVQKDTPLNPLDHRINTLKYKVYWAAVDAEDKGLIKEDKKQKIREACEISGPPTKINNKILKNIATDCSIHEARKKKSLENID